MLRAILVGSGLAVLLLAPAGPAAAQARVDCGAARVGDPGNEDHPVLFATGSAALDARAQRSLDRAASRIRGTHAGRVCLIGRASRIGDARANQRLSQQRIAAVRTALLRRGVQGSVLGSRAMGETAWSFGNPEDASGERSVVVAILP